MADCISYVDESGSEDTFVVGALTSTQPRWDALAHDWTLALAVPPAIPFFKFSNPHRLSATDHGAKIDALINLINQHVMRGDAAIVDTGEYEAYFKGLLSASFDTPPHFTYIQTLMQCALECPEKDGHISFVFDTMNELQLADLQETFHAFLEQCPNPEVKARLDQEPICEDDKLVAPLQAADLWAGVVKASVRGDKAAVEYLRKIAIPNRAYSWDRSRLAEVLSGSLKRAPDIASGKYYETKKQRRKRLNRRLMKRKGN